MGIATIFTLALMVFSGVVVYQGVKIVGQGRQYTIERFVKYTRTLEPGLHLIIPFFDRVGAIQDMREKLIEVPEQSVITQDNATVSVDGVGFYQVIDAAKATYEVENLEIAIRTLIITNIRTVFGSMSMDELLSNRERISAKLIDVVDEATSPWGVKTTRIEIQKIAPPERIVEAMDRQITAEREKRATVTAAAGDREAAIARARGEKESSVLRAEGQKQATILEAQGQREAIVQQAMAREREAEAEAKATHMLSKAMASGDREALQYFVAQQYTKALTQIAEGNNSRLVFMPLEASSLVGAIGGIKELLNNPALSEGPPLSPPPPPTPPTPISNAKKA